MQTKQIITLVIFPSKKHIKYADNARSVPFTKKCKYYVRFSKCYAKNYASIINKSLIAVGRGGEGRGGGRKELENANEIA